MLNGSEMLKPVGTGQLRISSGEFNQATVGIEFSIFTPNAANPPNTAVVPIESLVQPRACSGSHAKKTGAFVFERLYSIAIARRDRRKSNEGLIRNKGRPLRGSGSTNGESHSNPHLRVRRSRATGLANGTKPLKHDGEESAQSPMSSTSMESRAKKSVPMKGWGKDCVSSAITGRDQMETPTRHGAQYSRSNARSPLSAPRRNGDRICWFRNEQRDILSGLTSVASEAEIQLPPLHDRMKVRSGLSSLTCETKNGRFIPSDRRDILSGLTSVASENSIFG